MSLTSGFSATCDGDPVTIVSGVLLNGGTKIRLTVTREDGEPIEEGQTVTLSYLKNSGDIVSVDEGTQLQDITDRAVTNNSLIEIPAIATAVVDITGTRIAFTFTREVGVFSSAGFTIGASGDPVEIRGVILDEGGMSGTFIVDAIYDNTNVTIEYSRASGATVGAATGNELTEGAVLATNNSTRIAPTPIYIRATAAGVEIIADFDEPVDGTADLGWSGTNVTQGYALSFSSITRDIAQDTFTFALSGTLIYEDDVVTLSYTSTTGDLVADANNAIEVMSFTSAAVSNESTLQPMTITTTAVAIDGESIVVTTLYDIDVTVGTVTGFTATVNGDALVISSIAYGPGDDELTLNLATAVYADDTVTLTYAPGNVVSTVGHALVAYTDLAVTMTAAPVWEPSVVPDMVDFGIWNNASNLAIATTGAFGTVAVGDFVQRWRGEMAAITLASNGWTGTDPNTVLTTTGIRGALHGASTYMTASLVRAYTAPLTLMVVRRAGNATAASKTPRIQAYRAGAAILSASITIGNVTAIRNGSTAASFALTTASYPRIDTVFVTTDGTNTVDVYAGAQTYSGGGGAVTGSTTTLYLDMQALGTPGGDPTLCGELLAWAVIDREITASERARFEAFVSGTLV